MKTTRLTLGLCAAGLLLASPWAGSAERSRNFARTGPEGQPGQTYGRVIVTYKQNRVSALSARSQSSDSAQEVREAQTLNQRHGLDLRDGRTLAPRTQVLISSTASNERLLQTLAADPDVASVSVDHWRHPHAAPNDTLYPSGLTGVTPAAGQWYLHAPNSSVVSSINAEGAWNTTTGSASMVVAVLDSGVRPDHPDLVGKLLAGYDFVHQAANANDGDVADGDPSDPGDWISASDRTGSNSTAFSTCTITDSSWHGTQTAALVGAASNNGMGMASVGRNVMVLPVRVLGKCGGFDSDIISGMRWAAGLAVAGVTTNPRPARVINLSLGSSGSCDSGTNTTYADTVATLNSMGVVVVASAGNDALAVNAPGNCTGVIAVAGLRHAGTKNGYSSLGAAATIAAPAGNCVTTSGVCQYPILSASNSGTTTPVNNIYTSGVGDYGVGTSYSAPMVSGTVALMLAANPSLTAAQVRSLLTSTVRSFPTTGGSSGVASCHAPTGTAVADEQDECYCTTSTCGAGMLDTQAAVLAATTGRAVAHLGGTPPLVTPGNSVTLDGSASSAATGASLSSYLWEVTEGSALASITSASNASTVTLSTTAGSTGPFTVRLSVTDSGGNIATATQTFTVGSSASVVTAVPSSTPADSGGGGALDVGWALLLALAGAAAVWRNNRQRGVA